MHDGLEALKRDAGTRGVSGASGASSASGAGGSAAEAEAEAARAKSAVIALLIDLQSGLEPTIEAARRALRAR
jgi:hypothetical protein